MISTKRETSGVGPASPLSDKRSIMERFTYEQKVSMMRILLDLVLADGRIDERETVFFDKIAGLLNLDENAKKDVDAKNSLLALTEISEYSQDQKEELSKLMGQMIVVDEDINYNEIRIYNVVNDFCKINIGFDMEDYPDYSRSGGFLPE